MRTLIIILLSLPSMVLAQTFIDQVDGDSALICSDGSGEWVCKPVPIDAIEIFGFTDVEGLIFLDQEPIIDKGDGC